MRWWRFGPGIGRTAASGSASGPAIATADRCLRAPFLRLAGDERQPRQVFRQQLATFGSDQPITEERKAGPRAGQVDTVVWVELNLAAISSLAGVSGSRQEPSQRPSHCHAEPTNRTKADTAFRIMYIMFYASWGGWHVSCRLPGTYSGMEPDRA